METNSSHGARAAIIDEIKAREDAIWAENWQYGGTTVKTETRRKLHTTYRMAECLTYGFTPLVWDNSYGGVAGWTFARRAECQTCGHVVATNQPSWMRKHARSKHGVESFPRISSVLA